MPNELDDLSRPLELPQGTVAFDRDARFFVTHRQRADRLREECRVVRLVPDELLHPAPPCDFVLRRGNLRVSELLADGREVARAVLQAGAVCQVREGAPAGVGDDGGSPLYSLGNTVFMALGETEIWYLPAGSLDAH
ncbi:MAG TPA: hypothetical protein PLL30_02600 [Candidatus Krumholzibacteria bacterium]|nr:hypothetical protein [Candidatus Krumholzibacteria bacterium]HPD70659.1 hypothetical protein [Candidatus Krumholzibacteria bacterium]HRY39641.1 hypothetical protein [Candidatus Krumholzibacteria bacterium]